MINLATENPAVILAYIAIAAGTFASIAGIFVTRYFAKKPINGEYATLREHDKKIEKVQDIIEPIKKNIETTKRVWKTHH